MSHDLSIDDPELGSIVSRLFRQMEKRNWSTFVCISRRSLERLIPAYRKLPGCGEKEGSGKHLFDIFEHVSHSSTSPSSLYCRLAERTLSRKLLNRRRFPRSTSSSSSSSSSSSLSRIERRDAREGKGKPNGMLRHGFDKRQDERSDALRLPRTNVHVETETRGVPPSFPPDLASTLLKGRRRRRRRW